MEDPVAYYTLWLAFFTTALAIGGLIQSILVGRQIGLAREEFNASHRPKLVVREVDIHWVGNLTQISFVLINEGEGHAQGIGGAFQISERIMHFDAMRHPIQIETLPAILETGEAVTLTGTCPINMPRFMDPMRLSDPKFTRLEFVGHLSYCGGTGMKRRSAYHRPFEPKNLRFIPSDDPEREYPG